MKREIRIGIVFGVLLMFLALVSLQPVSACPPGESDLIAGQHYVAGVVRASVSGPNLIIEYKAGTGWTIEETHLWVGEDWDDMPQTKKGNPKIGKFPYSSQLTYTVPIPASIEYGDTILIVAHAVVDGPGFQGETAWADLGNQIPGASCWALHFPYLYA